MSSAECSAAFLCSCLPVLKPIIVRVNSFFSHNVSRFTSNISGRRDTGSKRLSLHSDREHPTFYSNNSQKGIHRVREYDVDVDVIPLQSSIRSSP